ncbi:hypothetical protein C8J56DRAFT_971620 [Mycena floridula]|nr:hypothetical protein C8J56DRAFT_971620 [Mycena floridula]
MTLTQSAATQPVAIVLFLVTLVAFVLETQLTQADLGYRQPFFIFYLVHSSFALTLPLHLLYLSLTKSNRGPIQYLRRLRRAVVDQASNSGLGFISLVLWLTCGINMPALLWFAAVSLTSIGDVTAIWNTNAAFAYLISVKVFQLALDFQKLFAVILATIGVSIVVYGSMDPGLPSSAPLLGDLLCLTASIGYAITQVFYKKFAALPEPTLKDYDQLEDEPLPFGLHANMLTSSIGVCTFAILWIPIPFLHYYRIEPFRIPPDLATVWEIIGVAAGGVVFNAGIMIFIGLWGPIVTSVGSLLTIVLVFVSDIVFGAGLSVLTISSVLGSTMVVAAFGLMAYSVFV